MNNPLGPKPNAKPSIGFLIIFFGLIAYAIAVATVGGWMTDWHVAIQTVYYIVAGIAWVFPARKVLIWALKGNEIS